MERAYQISWKIDPQRPTLRHTLLKLSDSKNKEKSGSKGEKSNNL